MQTIMLVPVTLNSDAEGTAMALSGLLTNKKVAATFLPTPNLETVETLLANDNIEELFENFISQREKLVPNMDLVLLAGVPLSKPYAAALNFALANALGAAIIFLINVEQNLEPTLRQAKIIINPYQALYRRTMLGYIINQNQAWDLELLKQQLALIKQPLPLIGVLSEKPKLDADTILRLNDFSPIQKFLATPVLTPITPPLFKYRLIERACRTHKKIVLPEGEEPRTLEAANICSSRGIAEYILLGKKDLIHATCTKLKLKLDEKITIIEPPTVIDKYTAPLYEIRRNKGLTIAGARTQLEDHVMLGTMMLHLGEVDGLVSRAIHTTANTIRPAFQIIKTAPSAKLVSSVLFMCLPDQVLVYGDCAINPNPTAEELADIAIQSANSAVAFGISPKIAMLSYSTGTSGYGPSVDKVRAATAMVKALRPDLEIEGPIQYDAAISEETARVKAPHSKVAGHATVFIMTSLDVGNIAYKTVQRSTGVVCVGPMLQGLRKPVNDLSRGCLMEDIVFIIAITAIQADSS